METIFYYKDFAGYAYFFENCCIDQNFQKNKHY